MEVRPARIVGSKTSSAACQRRSLAPQFPTVRRGDRKRSQRVPRLTCRQQVERHRCSEATTLNGRHPTEWHFPCHSRRYRQICREQVINQCALGSSRWKRSKSLRTKRPRRAAPPTCKQGAIHARLWGPTTRETKSSKRRRSRQRNSGTDPRHCLRNNPLVAASALRRTARCWRPRCAALPRTSTLGTARGARPNVRRP